MRVRNRMMLPYGSPAKKVAGHLAGTRPDLKDRRMAGQEPEQVPGVAPNRCFVSSELNASLSYDDWASSGACVL